jgi:hypothetical protein
LVYKRLEFIRNKYFTPYRQTKVNIGSKGTQMKAELAILGSQVNQGIHAHTNKAFAIHKSNDSDMNGIVVEAIIPKGARYLKGNYNDIVASEMKLGRIIHRCKEIY